jgi:hypothetical protein
VGGITGRRVKSRHPMEQRGTYVVEIFVREAITFHFCYAIHEQGTRRTHEAARSRLRESLFEHAKEGMGMERWVLISRRVWR